MRVLFALPGLHKYDRGAEIAFISIATELARDDVDVTLIGSGHSQPQTPYRFLRVRSLARSHFSSFPSVPILRNEYAYEELTFTPGLLIAYKPSDYDVTVSCSYPFTNWVLRRPALRGRRPPHVFVTQNGDWPAYSDRSEYRLFGCEGLICTNPDYYERNRQRWRCQLIPNGVDCERFVPATPQRKPFGLPSGKMIVLMVSALIPSKRVELGIEAVSRMPDVHLVVAGVGPHYGQIRALADRLLPDRFTLLSVPPEQMPSVYQSANVFLHLSTDESFGNVFLEALACGLPIVARDTPRTRWIVGDDQFLFQTDSPASVAACISSAGDSPPNANLGRISRARTFSWASVGRMYKNFLQEIVV